MLTYRLKCCLAVLLFLASCHDAPRKNPFDPELTPAVELSVALDDTAGTATLTWTPYAGKAEFAEYRVLRNVAKSTEVDTLAIIDQISQTTFIDLTLAQHIDYQYRVSAVNISGFTVSSDAREVGPLLLPGVQIAKAEFDPRTATATLEWTPYVGGGFSAYQVRRRTAELASQVVFETEDSAITSFTDSALVGATEYVYQVVVLTDGGEDVVGPERSGGIHLPVASWPLPIEGRPFVRLYSEPGRRIALLLSGSAVERIKLWLFSNQGELIEKQVLREIPAQTNVYPRLAETLLDEQEQRYLSSGVWASPGGAWQDFQENIVLFDENLSENNDPMELTVLGDITLVADGNGWFDNVTVTANGEALFEEDFSIFSQGKIEAQEVEDWEVTGDIRNRGGWIGADEGTHGDGPGGKLHKTADSEWQDFSLEIDIYFSLGAITQRNRRPGIQIGGDTFSQFFFFMDATHFNLDWTFNPPEGIDLESHQKRFSVPFPATWLSYTSPIRLSFQMVDGRVEIWMKFTPVLWENESFPYWSSGAFIGEDLFALTTQERTYTISLDGEMIRQAELDSWASAIRSWKLEGERGRRIGICLPDLNQVRIGQIPSGRESRWDQFLNRQIGPMVSLEQGALFHPLSFDVGPDGRIYVLDAGNGRIVVYDKDRNYITHWGRRGSGPGEFDFGVGGKLLWGLDFVGSICVDDDGFIYVADVFNRRIQKFAP